VRALKAGQVQFKVEKAGIVHVPVGKVSFDAARLRENFLAFFEAIQRARPPAAKGTFVKAVTLSSTMGPGVKVDVNYLQAQQK
jgi:large subunit ribosomal protein L1